MGFFYSLEVFDVGTLIEMHAFIHSYIHSYIQPIETTRKEGTLID